MVFHKSIETLQKIEVILAQRQKGAYLRFGDGDIVLARGTSSQDQPVSEALSAELRESLAINNPNALKTLPLYCKKYGGIEEGMFPGNHESEEAWADNILSTAKKYWGAEVTDVYSHVALHYLAAVDTEKIIAFLRALREQDQIVFVGNEQTTPSLLSLLFGGSVIHVKTPPQNSYSRIQQIESESIKAITDEYTVVVTAMGDAGRVLQKRLWYKTTNTFLFDFGSLLCILDSKTSGKNWRAWYELSGIFSKRDQILEGLA